METPCIPMNAEEEALIAGIRIWLRENKRSYKGTELSTFDFDDLAFTEGPLVAANRLIKFNVSATLETIKTLGADSMGFGIGCNIQGSIQQIEMTGGRRLLGVSHCYTTPAAGWDTVDGVHKSSIVGDDEARYASIADWKNNSCAYSATLFVAIMIEAGRSYYDQLIMTETLRLSRASATFRDLLCQPLARFDCRMMCALRDHIRHQLHTSFPYEFTLGGWDALHMVYEKLMSSSPTVSFVLADTEFCCDGALLKSNPSLTLIEYNTIHVTFEESAGQSVSQRVNKFFTSRPTKQPNLTSNCASGDKCTRKVWAKRVVIDRLPPILSIALPSVVTRAKNSSAKIFDRLTVSAIDSKGVDVSKSYEPCGVIYMFNKGHYATRWVRQGKIYFYDDYESGKAKVKELKGDVCSIDWFSGIGPTNGATMVFYK